MPTKENSEFVSKATLQEMLDAQSRDMKRHFDERLAAVNEDIAALKSELKSKDNDIINLKAEINSIKAENKTLEARMTTLQATTIESFKQLEEKVEDRTNRQLRQTIVVKGLAEKPNEKWADTKNLLAKHVSKNYQMEFKTAFALFDRVHRGGGNGFQDRKKGKRDIYALCAKWEDSEYLVWNSYGANKNKPKKDRVVIEYKYGPLTTLRRGEAMKKRKELLDNKLCRNAYVRFPAMLMVRKEGEEKYTMSEDFSNVCKSKLPILVSE